MEGNENGGMEDMSEKRVDTLVTREGTMSAIVAEDEDGPHEESGEEPEKGKIESVIGCTIGEVGAVVEGGDEEGIANDIVNAEGEVGLEAMGRDVALNFGEGGDFLVGDMCSLGCLHIAKEVHVVHIGIDGVS